MTKIEKQKRIIKVIPCILLIIFFALAMFNYYQYYNNVYFNVLDVLYNSIHDIIFAFPLELGLLLYFIQSIRRKENEANNDSRIMLCFGLISILYYILCFFLTIRNGNLAFSELIDIGLYILIYFGITQYFISINNNYNKSIIIKIVAIIASLISCFLYGYYYSKNFSLLNLFLILSYISLIPYFYFIDLKDDDRFKINKEKLSFNISGKIIASICVILYLIINCVELNSFENIPFLLAIVIITLLWLNAKNMAMLISIYGIVDDLLLIFGFHMYETVKFSSVILLIIEVIILKNMNIEKEPLIEEKQQNEEENNQELIDNGRYKELLDMGIIDEKDYEKVTKGL